MRLLLDTHTWAWAVNDDPLLSARVRGLISDPSNELIVSAVVPWELATKFRVGKWAQAEAILRDLDAAISQQNVTSLEISHAHAKRGGLLPFPNRDPFDRILAAQAELEGVPLVTADRVFRQGTIEVIW
jgi:PIN domain nuclease of toxin-antitoxin system